MLDDPAPFVSFFLTKRKKETDCEAKADARRAALHRLPQPRADEEGRRRQGPDPGCTRARRRPLRDRSRQGNVVARRFSSADSRLRSILCRFGVSKISQAYARPIVDDVRVSDEEIGISGSKTILARCIAADESSGAPAVLSLVQEWRTRRDSNPWPLPSEGSSIGLWLVARL